MGGIAHLWGARCDGRGVPDAPLTGEYCYLWVDATYPKIRVDGRVISQATVVAVGVSSEGDRQILGIDVGPSEDRPFWTAFLRSRVKRGLKGVRLVISDAHEGLKQAISTVLTGTAWQRCRCISCATCWRPSRTRIAQRALQQARSHGNG